MKKITLPVKGMHCETCVQKIEQGVGSMEGVTNINADLLANDVTIDYYPDKTSKETILSKLSELGYSSEKKQQTWKQAVVYGLIPHIGCIGFILASVIGATVAMSIFRPLLMNRYIFHFLILISIGFATVSSVVYLRKNKLLTIKGIKRKKGYLATMYGITVGINLLLFFFVFPMLANLNPTGALIGVADSELSTLSISVDIPCPGHAPLITSELKALSGISSVIFSFPNNFEVKYNPEITPKSEMLTLEVFDEYKPTVLSSTEAESINKAPAPSSSCDGSCGGTGSCGKPTCGCGG